MEIFERVEVEVERRAAGREAEADAEAAHHLVEVVAVDRDGPARGKFLRFGRPAARGAPGEVADEEDAERLLRVGPRVELRPARDEVRFNPAERERLGHLFGLLPSEVDGRQCKRSAPEGQTSRAA